jgi:hypothetical protein
MLLLDNLPADLVDKPGFHLLLGYLAPSYSLPSAADLKSKIIPRVLSKLPNKDINAYRQYLLENNRPSHGGSWPISPSTTCESGYSPI